MSSTNKIDKSKFKVVGKNVNSMESISRPNLTYWADAWRRIRKNKIAFAGLLIITIYIILAIIGPSLQPYDYTTTNAQEMNQSPSMNHLFGTDDLGRDLWERMWLGARVSLSIGFIATFINTIIGGIVGGIAGFYGGKVDTVIMRIIDVLYGIPTLIIAILMMIVLGTGILPLIAAMVVVGWIGTARLIRGEILKLKEQDFVSAAKVLGVTNSAIILKHLIPNVMGLIITTWTMAVPQAIFYEAFLSYIGLGIQPPECSWGQLAKVGVKTLRIYPYQLFIPAFFISSTMLALNLLGDGLRDALDPKLRGTE